jgi:hypothetical protein
LKPTDKQKTYFICVCYSPGRANNIHKGLKMTGNQE